MIFACRNRKQNQIYAIKFLEIQAEEEDNLQHEIEILKEAGGSPNVGAFRFSLEEENLLHHSSSSSPLLHTLIPLSSEVLWMLHEGLLSLSTSLSEFPLQDSTLLVRERSVWVLL